MIILVIIVVVDLPKRKWTLMCATKTFAKIATLLVEFVAAMQQYVMVVK
jgi:hypothetical protein